VLLSARSPRLVNQNRSAQVSRLAQGATLEDNYHEQAASCA